MSPRERRRLLSIVAAVVVAVAVTVTVVAFGAPRTPALPTIAERPEPAPADTVVFLGDRDDQRCVVLVRDARERVGGCVDGHARLTVSSAGAVSLRRQVGGVEVVSAIDPETGELRERRATRPGERATVQPPGSETADGRRAFTERRDDVVVVAVAEPDGDIRDLAEVPAHERYHLREPAWSPDGRWLALVDSADRLLLVDAHDTEPVRVLAEDASDPVWMPAGADEGRRPSQPSR